MLIALGLHLAAFDAAMVWSLPAGHIFMADPDGAVLLDRDGARLVEVR